MSNASTAATLSSAAPHHKTPSWHGGILLQHKTDKARVTMESCHAGTVGLCMTNLAQASGAETAVGSLPSAEPAWVP